MEGVDVELLKGWFEGLDGVGRVEVLERVFDRVGWLFRMGLAQLRGEEFPMLYVWNELVELGLVVVVDGSARLSDRGLGVVLVWAPVVCAAVCPEEVLPLGAVGGNFVDGEGVGDV